MSFISPPVARRVTPVPAESPDAIRARQERRNAEVRAQITRMARFGERSELARMMREPRS